MHIPHQIYNHTTHYHSFHTWFPLFELKNVTIYWRSPKGILEIGKTGSVEFGFNVPNPLASSYRTFTLPKESKCCIYIRDKWKKSSGIESLLNAVACSLSNSLSNSLSKVSWSPVSTYMNQLLTTHNYKQNVEVFYATHNLHVIYFRPQIYHLAPQQTESILHWHSLHFQHLWGLETSCKEDFSLWHDMLQLI